MIVLQNSSDSPLFKKVLWVTFFSALIGGILSFLIFGGSPKDMLDFAEKAPTVGKQSLGLFGFVGVIFWNLLVTFLGAIFFAFAGAISGLLFFLSRRAKTHHRVPADRDTIDVTAYEVRDDFDSRASDAVIDVQRKE